MFDWLPDFLFEGQFTIYAILAVAIVFLFFVWKKTPRTAYLIGLCSAVLLIAIYLLLDFAVETDREQIVNAVKEMSAGVKERNVDRIFANVSDTYNRHGQDKGGFRAASSSVVNGNLVDRVVVWSWEFPPNYKTKESASDARENIAHVKFMAKPEGTNGANMFYIDAVMHRDADGHWRLQSWEAFDPFRNDKPVSVPYIP